MSKPAKLRSLSLRAMGKKQCLVYLDPNTHRALRLWALGEEKTHSEIVESLILRNLPKKYQPEELKE